MGGVFGWKVTTGNSRAEGRSDEIHATGLLQEAGRDERVTWRIVEN